MLENIGQSLEMMHSVKVSLLNVNAPCILMFVRLRRTLLYSGFTIFTAVHVVTSPAPIGNHLSSDEIESVQKVIFVVQIINPLDETVKEKIYVNIWDHRDERCFLGQYFVELALFTPFVRRRLL